MTKRALSPGASSATRRVKPSPIQGRPFVITNLDNGELVYQTCVVVHGECQKFDYAHETNFVSVTSSSDVQGGRKTVQHWPLSNGRWSALVMLAPGTNTLSFQLHHAGGISSSLQLSVSYLPLLQLPPLHLAVLVAKDSPLLIDCPPAKYGAFSTAHSSINAAIAKLRMSAYMWQALTAEDFRQKGLGRRSFRLEEEWTTNTTIQSAHQTTPGDRSNMGSTAKVHIVRSEKTVAELRDAQVAQQNSHGRDRDALHRYFEEALATSGPPFDSTCRPVVAGMLLDAHYSTERAMIMGHAALGCHKPHGISLGIFGSHLAYSWPRFLEEVPACLTDTTPTGDTVGNDNGECDTMLGACFVGQGAFLHEVGHAFGAGHTTGIMARGYSKTWGMNFIAHESNDSEENEAKWDLHDALKFKLLPHFALPGDDPVTSAFKNAKVKIEIDTNSADNEMIDDDKHVNEGFEVSCAVGLAQVTIQNGNNSTVVHDFVKSPHRNRTTAFTMSNVREKFDESQPLKITALGQNGKMSVVMDLWAMFLERPFITIPGSNLVLTKRSVRSSELDANPNKDQFAPWAMLLRHRGQDGQLHRATSIDLRVGCIMDGAVVYYADGQHANCGPARNDYNGEPHTFGGHASEKHDLPADGTITKVQICRASRGWGGLGGIRMTLSDGEEWGYLNRDEDDDDDEGDDEEAVVTLEPDEDEVIVGFCGQSQVGSGYTYEFGILTAPKEVELPDNIYDMAALQNPC